MNKVLASKTRETRVSSDNFLSDTFSLVAPSSICIADVAWCGFPSWMAHSLILHAICQLCGEFRPPTEEGSG